MSSNFIHACTLSLFEIVHASCIDDKLVKHRISRLDLQMVEWTKGGQKVVNTVEAIDDIYRRVNPDAVEENKLTMAQHAGWEQFLGPAPLTIVLLGQLMRLGMMKDFSLIEDWHPPKTFGLQYLNLPNSFRASVVQVIKQFPHFIECYKMENSRHKAIFFILVCIGRYYGVAGMTTMCPIGLRNKLMNLHLAGHQ